MWFGCCSSILSNVPSICANQVVIEPNVEAMEAKSTITKIQKMIKSICIFLLITGGG